MSTEGEKRCPLCAEEMDWTDQQFKPCKCGYQMCVWCWHHLIDMAEKDATEGRCPACRAVYEKDKIVAMQADCERAVAAPCNKKSKPPKAKAKPIEVKRDLTTVRVIQRKMAYVIGLPNSLADEDILRRKEYFGQYGKITKISLSRTAGGAIQQFINDTCSIYVTYSCEEEAVRCIHSVHGFMLEGRFLRASFGTAKYCHAWLRNMVCSNPACLYLHTMGADEDSFGRDEAASVHTRNRVHEVAGASSNILKRSGNILPPPIDEFADSTSSSLEKSIGRSSVSDPVHGDHSTAGKITFVDIVGRPSSKGSVKYESSAEDRRILDLCSDQSSATKDKDISSNALLYKVPAAGHLVSRVPRDRTSHESYDELVREDVRHGDFSSNESMTQRTFHSSSNSTRVSEDSSGHTRLHQRTHSSSSFSIDQSSVHSLEDEASLPFTCVKSVLNDQGNELKFQTSAKSDRIYRSSNSFSNEEIVEHLRRISDENATYDDEKCALDAVESSIISNIMSIDLDSLDDSLTLPPGLTELLDETDDRHGSSWDSYTSRESGFSFSRLDGFAGASFESPLNNLGQVSNSSARDHYFSNSQHQAQNPPCLAPPGFSLPQREAPPGFSLPQGTARYPLSSSGGFLNVSSPPNSYQMPPSSGMNTRLVSNQGMGGLENDSRRWHVMQQESNAEQASQYSQFYGQQTAPQGQMRYSEVSNMNDAYGYPSSRSMDQHQTYDQRQTYDLSYGNSSQQKFGNMHMSSGYPYGLPEAQRSQVGVGTNNYYSGYGDSMFPMTNTGDVYTRVFGM